MFNLTNSNRESLALEEWEELEEVRVNFSST